jgi:hypothetical protein
MNCPIDNTPMAGSDKVGFHCPKCGYVYNPHDDRPLPGDPTPKQQAMTTGRPDVAGSGVPGLPCGIGRQGNGEVRAAVLT